LKEEQPNQVKLREKKEMQKKHNKMNKPIENKEKEIEQ